MLKMQKRRQSLSDRLDRNTRAAGFSLEVAAGEFVAVTGPSGSARPPS